MTFLRNLCLMAIELVVLLFLFTALLKVFIWVAQLLPPHPLILMGIFVLFTIVFHRVWEAFENYFSSPA